MNESSILNMETDQEVVKAKSVMARVLPETMLHECVLQQLRMSADAAAGMAPGAWAVTLFGDGFRLNVGQVEVLVLAGGWLHVNLMGSANEVPFVGPDFVVVNYQSVPQPTCAFRGRVEEFSEIQATIQTAHLEFVRRAAVTRSGRPRRGTPFRRSHCEGLITYARILVNAAVENQGLNSCLQQDAQPSHAELVEGTRIMIQVNAYERSPEARRRRLEHHGRVCVVCGFDFEKFYGSVAAGYVHVHHLKPIATIGRQYVVDPLVDLVPVCANCHSVIHLHVPPYTVDEIKGMIESRVKNSCVAS